MKGTALPGGEQRVWSPRDLGQAVVLAPGDLALSRATGRPPGLHPEYGRGPGGSTGWASAPRDRQRAILPFSREA